MAHGRKPKVWFELFDTAEMDHVCEAARVSVLNVAHGEPSAMHVPLRRWLLDPLDAYLQEHWRPGVNYIHVQAAERMRDAVERLADRFADRWPFDGDDAQREAAALRFAWLEFIAYGAAHHVYHLALKRHKHGKDAASSGPRKAGTRDLTPQVVAARVKAARAKVGARFKLSGLVGELADEFDVSDGTVWGRIKTAREEDDLLK